MHCQSPRKSRYRVLVIVLGIVSTVWLVVLPRIGESPAVRIRIERHRSSGINPTAVFYTDHPGMTNIERSVASCVDHPDRAFWIPFQR
jgi:hypothetical protein